MNRKELEVILKEGEGYKIEFKEGVMVWKKNLLLLRTLLEGKYFLE